MEKTTLWDKQPHDIYKRLNSGPFFRRYYGGREIFQFKLWQQEQSKA